MHSCAQLQTPLLLQNGIYYLGHVRSKQFWSGFCNTTNLQNNCQVTWFVIKIIQNSRLFKKCVSYKFPITFAQLTVMKCMCLKKFLFFI